MTSRVVDPMDSGPGGWGPVVVRWPTDCRTVHELMARRVPQLLIVAGGADPPEFDDPLIDWVRFPIDERDLDARLDVLRERGRRWFPSLSSVRLDGAGRLYRHPRWVAVTPTEEQLLRVLLDRPGAVISRGELLEVGWPRGDGTDGALRLQMMRLRQRIAPLGLEVRTLRGMGYVFESVDDSPRPGPAN